MGYNETGCHCENDDGTDKDDDSSFQQEDYLDSRKTLTKGQETMKMEKIYAILMKAMSLTKMKPFIDFMRTTIMRLILLLRQVGKNLPERVKRVFCQGNLWSISSRSTSSSPSICRPISSSLLSWFLPLSTLSKRSFTGKEFCLAAGLAVGINSGSVLAFGLINSQVKDLCELSTKEIDFVMSMGSAGSYITILVGYIFDRFGPFFTVLYGSILAVGGYLFFGFNLISCSLGPSDTNSNSESAHVGGAFQAAFGDYLNYSTNVNGSTVLELGDDGGGFTNPSHSSNSILSGQGPYNSFLPISANLAISFLMVGQGGSALFYSALFTNIRRFSPKVRGRIIGALASCCGASAAILGLIFDKFFAGKNVADYVFFLAFSLAISSVVGMTFFRLPKGREDDFSMNDSTEMIDLRKGDLAKAQRENEKNEKNGDVRLKGRTLVVVRRELARIAYRAETESYRDPSHMHQSDNQNACGDMLGKPGRFGDTNSTQSSFGDFDGLKGVGGIDGCTVHRLSPASDYGISRSRKIGFLKHNDIYQDNSGFNGTECTSKGDRDDDSLLCDGDGSTTCGSSPGHLNSRNHRLSYSLYDGEKREPVKVEGLDGKAADQAMQKVVVKGEEGYREEVVSGLSDADHETDSKAVRNFHDANVEEICMATVYSDTKSNDDGPWISDQSQASNDMGESSRNVSLSSASALSPSFAAPSEGPPRNAMDSTCDNSQSLKEDPVLKSSVVHHLEHHSSSGHLRDFSGDLDMRNKCHGNLRAPTFRGDDGGKCSAAPLKFDYMETMFQSDFFLACGCICLSQAVASMWVGNISLYSTSMGQTKHFSSWLVKVFSLANCASRLCTGILIDIVRNIVKPPVFLILSALLGCSAQLIFWSSESVSVSGSGRNHSWGRRPFLDDKSEILLDDVGNVGDSIDFHRTNDGDFNASGRVAHNLQIAEKGLKGSVGIERFSDTQFRKYVRKDASDDSDDTNAFLMQLAVTNLGISYGINLSTLPSLICDRFGAENLGTLMATVSSCVAFSSFILNMVAGTIYDLSAEAHGIIDHGSSNSSIESNRKFVSQRVSLQRPDQSIDHSLSRNGDTDSMSHFPSNDKISDTGHINGQVSGRSTRGDGISSGSSGGAIKDDTFGASDDFGGRDSDNNDAGVVEVTAKLLNGDRNPYGRPYQSIDGKNPSQVDSILHTNHHHRHVAICRGPDCFHVTVLICLLTCLFSAILAFLLTLQYRFRMQRL